MKKKRLNRIEKILEMPREVVSNVPKVSIYGFNEMIIENYRSIIEYENFFVKIKTHIGIININGLNLKLENMNRDDIRITGIIDSIDFESFDDELEENNC